MCHPGRSELGCQHCDDEIAEDAAVNHCARCGDGLVHDRCLIRCPAASKPAQASVAPAKVEGCTCAGTGTWCGACIVAVAAALDVAFAKDAAAQRESVNAAIEVLANQPPVAGETATEFMLKMAARAVLRERAKR